jgi:DivIVA domain-containing protein
MRKNKAEGAEADDGGTRRAPTGSGPAGRLTPLDIQQVEFRRSFKGYDEREVDEFLDRLTEDFAAALDEAQRLRDRAEGGLGTVVAGTADQAAARREAEEITRRAREEAARIVRDAEARAAQAPMPAPLAEGDRAAISAFLSTERAFLTSLASLVQGHAETVKGMAATAQRRAATHAAPEGSRPATASAVAPPGPRERGGAPPPRSEPADASAGDGDREDAAGSSRPQAERDRDAALDVGAEPRATGTPTPPGEGHVTIPDPDPAGARAGDPKLAEGDPALRDLFWDND